MGGWQGFLLVVFIYLRHAFEGFHAILRLFEESDCS